MIRICPLAMGIQPIWPGTPFQTSAYNRLQYKYNNSIPKRKKIALKRAVIKNELVMCNFYLNVSVNKS